jgi:MoxR-like ATPase
MAQVNLNTTELKKFMNHIVANNQYLQTNGKIPVAVAVEGEAGIGKTSTILQIGKELGLQVVKINLSQIEEIGDLTGFPLKEFEVKKQGEDGKVVTKWVPESLMPMYVQNKYVPSGEKRMSHAAPEWIQGRGEGGLLILDDYTRADKQIL